MRNSISISLYTNSQLYIYFTVTISKEFEDTIGVIRIRISKKNRQYSDQVKKDKQRSTKHKNKTKDRVTQTTLTPRGELMCSGRGSSFCSTIDVSHVILFTNP